MAKRPARARGRARPKTPPLKPSRPPADPFTALRLSLLQEKGYRQKDFKERWNKSQSFVSMLLHGKTRSRELEEDFARCMGKPHARLFPVHKQDLALRGVA